MVVGGTLGVSVRNFIISAFKKPQPTMKRICEIVCCISLKGQGLSKGNNSEENHQRMFFVSCDLIFVTDVTIWQCPRQQFVENDSCEIDLNEPLLGHLSLSNL